MLCFISICSISKPWAHKIKTGWIPLDISEEIHYALSCLSHFNHIIQGFCFPQYYYLLLAYQKHNKTNLKHTTFI